MIQNEISEIKDASIKAAKEKAEEWAHRGPSKDQIISQEKNCKWKDFLVLKSTIKLSLQIFIIGFVLAYLVLTILYLRNYKWINISLSW